MLRIALSHARISGRETGGRIALAISSWSTSKGVSVMVDYPERDCNPGRKLCTGDLAKSVSLAILHTGSENPEWVRLKQECDNLKIPCLLVTDGGVAKDRNSFYLTRADTNAEQVVDVLDAWASETNGEFTREAFAVSFARWPLFVRDRKSRHAAQLIEVLFCIDIRLQCILLLISNTSCFSNNRSKPFSAECVWRDLFQDEPAILLSELGTIDQWNELLQCKGGTELTDLQYHHTESFGKLLEVKQVSIAVDRFCHSLANSYDEGAGPSLPMIQQAHTCITTLLLVLQGVRDEGVKNG